MHPMMKKALDVLIAVALTGAVVFVIVVANSFLLSRGGSAHGIRIFMNFIGRGDILGMMVLTAFVTMAYAVWQRRA